MDPVSWLLIEPGWHVHSSDGGELGHVEEVTGDSGADIFDGLSVATGAFARPRYVPAELIASIVDGAVTLSIDEAAFAKLGEYDEPAESAQIEPDKASMLGRLEERVVHPPTASRRVPLTKRLLEWLGLSGRR